MEASDEMLLLKMLDYIFPAMKYYYLIYFANDELLFLKILDYIVWRFITEDTRIHSPDQ